MKEAPNNKSTRGALLREIGDYYSIYAEEKMRLDNKTFFFFGSNVVLLLHVGMIGIDDTFFPPPCFTLCNPWK